MTSKLNKLPNLSPLHKHLLQHKILMTVINSFINSLRTLKPLCWRRTWNKQLLSRGAAARLARSLGSLEKSQSLAVCPPIPGLSELLRDEWAMTGGNFENDYPSNLWRYNCIWQHAHSWRGQLGGFLHMFTRVLPPFRSRHRILPAPWKASSRPPASASSPLV